MFITKGTKIQLVKPFANGILKVGDVFEITNLDHNGVITFKAPFDNFIMTMDIFLKYFKIVEEKEEKKAQKRTWSEWEYDWFYYFNLDGEEYIVPVKFRDNGKTVELRTNWKTGKNEDGKETINLKVKASCSKFDEFDFETGLNLADSRMTIKLLQRELDEIIESM